MKSERGALLLLTLKVIVLILIGGVAAYVLFSSDIFTKDKQTTVNVNTTNQVNTTSVK